MGKVHKGYVSVYNNSENSGFCIVHELDEENSYTSVRFHIDDVKGLKGVSERNHVLRGKVDKTPRGWKMKEIEATYSPDAWDSRPMIAQEKTDDTFESEQPERLPRSLQENEEVVDEV